MSGMTNAEKELIFEYSFGLCSEQDAQRARELIKSHPEGDRLHRTVRSSVSPLDSFEAEACPDYLVERTLLALKNSVPPGHKGLEAVLAQQQARTVVERGGFWRNFAEMAAVAAVIVLFAGVSIPSLRNARQQAWRAICQSQLGRIAAAIGQYSADNGGELPAVAMSSGEPWWKVGYQGQQNHSNTRHLWLLVQGGYAEPADFVCPARSQGRAVGLNRVHVEKLLDFPDRRNVTYSFRLIPRTQMKRLPDGIDVLMADLSPVFDSACPAIENRRYNCDELGPVELCEELLRANSRNHNGRGQNVLFADGSVQFKEDRKVGISLDDIFTIRGRDCYYGREVPSSDDDVFLAP